VPDLEPIEDHVRVGELFLPDSHVLRGWPLTTVGLLANAQATAARFSYRTEPFVAVSVEVTMPGWDEARILSGRRLRTRRSYASAVVGSVLASFELLPTFDRPHYSLLLRSYTEREAEQLLRVFGHVLVNPYYARGQS
jgi:hypothetical protein